MYGVSAAAVALPASERHLPSDSAVLIWILTAYAVGVGVGALAGGRLADLWGSRPVLATAAALLTVGALVCLIASTLAVVVAGRVLLAAGSGAAMAAALTATAGLPAARRPTALAAFGACLAGFSATAPLAGAAAAHWSWRVALVLPVLSVVAVPACWPMTYRLPRRTPVDWPGAALVTACAAGLLLIAHTAAGQPGVATIMITAATAALAVGVAVRARRRRDGFLPRGVLSASWFRYAAATGACVYGGLFGLLYAIPHLLTRQGHSTMDIGLLLLPGAVVGALLTRATVRAARRVRQGRVLAVVSLLLTAALCYAATDQRPWALATASTAAFTAAAVAQTLLSGYATTRAGAARGGAIGLLTLVTFLGGACGAAVCAAQWHTAGPAVALTVAAVLPAVGTITALRLPHDSRLLTRTGAVHAAPIRRA
ncbi:MFS transporter [Micromonospora sp. WMMD1082]|uniref:MFS transporter n=1 Tax=Micromonospora sp. WMMD1082 TaxID=3016104 RepID=UPI002417B932|nr:MFS transporter [Micromonospora sp. WMMD1082]MDG4794997.1 MFS transporter [Micromonospora sp. WMMD1082]